jgi:Flp pilus assembly pilin Flp
MLVTLRARISRRLADERGATMIEVLVSTATGVVVLAGLTMVIVVTMHSNARVSARIDANQQGRLAVTKVMKQLHSACVAPKIAPIQAASSGTLLKFIHAAPGEGNAVAPLPTMTELSLAGGVLTQTDRAAVGGTAPNWTYSATTTSRILLSGVAPIAPSSSIFDYYAGNNGSTTPTAQAVPLSSASALETVQVRIAFTVSPTRGTSIKDASAAATIRDGATLRLTPPSFNEAAVSLPCQ